MTASAAKVVRFLTIPSSSSSFSLFPIRYHSAAFLSTSSSSTEFSLRTCKYVRTIRRNFHVSNWRIFTVVVQMETLTNTAGGYMYLKTFGSPLDTPTLLPAQNFQWTTVYIYGSYGKNKTGLRTYQIFNNATECQVFTARQHSLLC